MRASGRVETILIDFAADEEEEEEDDDYLLKNQGGRVIDGATASEQTLRLNRVSRPPGSPQDRRQTAPPAVAGGFCDD